MRERLDRLNVFIERNWCYLALVASGTFTAENVVDEDPVMTVLAVVVLVVSLIAVVRRGLHAVRSRVEG